MNRSRWTQWRDVKRRNLERLPVNTKETETLEKIYLSVMASVIEAHQEHDWEVMARLLELAGDLCWRMKARLDDEDKS